MNQFDRLDSLPGDVIGIGNGLRQNDRNMVDTVIEPIIPGHALDIPPIDRSSIALPSIHEEPR